MSPTIDPFWLAGVLSSVNDTLTTLLYAVGLVVALRRWKERGRSARLAAAGFGIGLVGDLGEMALTFVNLRFFDPMADTGVNYDPYVWPMLAATSLRSFASLASMTLLLVALWFAWRDTDRANRGEPVM